MKGIGGFWVCVVCVGVALNGAEAQTEAPAQAQADTGKTKAQLLNELKLRKARVELDRGRNDLASRRRDLEIARALYNEKIYTLKELNDAQNAYQDAEMKYRQALLTLRQTRLDFLKDATHISVMEAKKDVLPAGGW